MDTTGTLYIVATPIGNVADISERARATLAEVDRVLAEDTRTTRKLLEHYGIKTPCDAVHDHNERDKVNLIAQWLNAGQNLALVSDAGTPLISDPGYHVVSSLRLQGFHIVPIPGPSALTAALSVCGLATDRFCFEGFLSSKSAGRRQKLTLLAREKRTLVFYEAPHRLLASIKDMSEIFGPQREASLCRELTKTFETVWTGPLSQLLEFVAADSNQQRGESVILVSGEASASKQDSLSSDDEHLLEILVTELPLKKAAVLAAKYTGKAKQAFYQYGLSLSASDAD